VLANHSQRVFSYLFFSLCHVLGLEGQQVGILDGVTFCPHLLQPKCRLLPLALLQVHVQSKWTGENLMVVVLLVNQAA